MYLDQIKLPFSKWTSSFLALLQCLMSQFNFAFALKDGPRGKTNRQSFIEWEFPHIRIEKWTSPSKLCKRKWQIKTKTFLVCVNWVLNIHAGWFRFYKPGAPWRLPSAAAGVRAFRLGTGAYAHSSLSQGKWPLDHVQLRCVCVHVHCEVCRMYTMPQLQIWIPMCFSFEGKKQVNEIMRA